MRVAIDCRPLGSGLGGDETMVRGFLRGLAVCAGDGDRFSLLVPDDAAVPTEVARSPRFVGQRIPRHPGSFHFSVTLPRVLRSLEPRPQAVFSSVHAPMWGGVPTALMVNDLSALRDPEWYPLRTRIRGQVTTRHQVPRAKVVLTVSEFSKREILGEFAIPPERVFVVPNTIDSPRALTPEEEQSCAQWLRGMRVHGPFVLYLGNLHPRKNVPRLVRAFVAASRHELRGHQLVIAGARWWGDDERQAMQHAYPGSVVMLGRVDDAQREYLLRSSRLLAYLSVYEGFGLPPVEAMARGTPVLAADRTSIPEVTGDAALLVDPFDVDAIGAALVRLATDDALRAELRAKGLEQAARFSVTETGTRALAALAAAVS
ncbi:MAG: glycosyltransferase family 1 protein [Acidimicrobiia bacterium]